MRDNFFYVKKIDLLLLQKYDLGNVGICMSILDKIDIVFTIVTLSEEDPVIKNILKFLEIIAGQKAGYSGKYKYIGPVKKFIFCGSVTLRKRSMIHFIYYLYIACLPLYFKRNGFICSKSVNNNYVFPVIDFDIFPNFNLFNLNGTLIINFVGKASGSSYKLDDFLQLFKIRHNRHEIFSSK